MNQYQVDRYYRDTGSTTNPQDQFLRWINITGSGIRNSGGVRPLKFTSLRLPVSAYLVLVTDERSKGSVANPWEDLIDLPHGRIIYWGDAKYDEKRNLHDFVGNRALAAAFDQVLEDRGELIPPILHFSKPTRGSIRFNGLCVLDRLELTWFEDHGRAIRNYRAHLTILDEELIDLEWLHRRVSATTREQLASEGPPAWKRYQAGYVDRLKIWAPQVRERESQIPPPSTDDAKVLSQLVAQTPTQFEASVVGLFRELDEVRHDITRTQPSKDGGFDFYGTFSFPAPLRYEIPFLGEAKKFGAASAVAPRHVSRLVARLSRGQYGIFVTTSYFTRQAQEEVLSDGYPTTLIAGGDVVRMMRELRIVRGAKISEAWLKTVEAELARTLHQLRGTPTAFATYATE